VAWALGGILLGGVGGVLLQDRLAVSSARRIRTDEAREQALLDLAVCLASVEGQADFMLGPSGRTPDGIFQTATVFPMRKHVADLRETWRTSAEPFAQRLGKAVLAVADLWEEAERIAGSENPPPQNFFGAVESVRIRAGNTRAAVQAEALRPSKRRWRKAV
jgi:hypothetical protein